MLHPGEVGVAHRRDAVLPTPVFPQSLAAPVGDVEGRVGQDVVGPQVRVAVIVKTVAVGDLPLDAPDGQVHLGQSPGSVVGFLTVDGQVASGPAAVAVPRSVGADEVHRLDEHPGRSATRVIDPAPVRFQHLHQQAYHRARGVELTALASLGKGELLQEILVHLPQHVVGLGFGSTDPDVADQVHHLA